MLACEYSPEQGPKEPELEPLIPTTVNIIRCKPWPLNWTRAFGFGSLGLRVRGAFRRAIKKIVQTDRPDLVFISTTEFALFKLGLEWKNSYGLNYVLDWQDPWVNDYYCSRPDVVPPGGRLRFALVDFLARREEPAVARAASQHIVVSSYYCKMLMTRYPDLLAEKFHPLAFGYSKLDFDHAANLTVPAPFQNSRYWIYAGRGGPDMQFSFRVFCRALRMARSKNPSRWSNLKIYFIGTNYISAPEQQVNWILPMAKHFEVADLVEEFPARLPLLKTLNLISNAEALLLPGSDDQAYNASKLLPLLAVNKPLLAILRAQGEAQSFASIARSAVLALFESNSNEEELRIAEQLQSTWFECDSLPEPNPNIELLHSEESLQKAKKIVDIFELAVKSNR